MCTLKITCLILLLVLFLAINQKSGKIEDGSNGDVAADHYHRYKVSIIRNIKDILSSAHASFLTLHKSVR